MFPIVGIVGAGKFGSFVAERIRELMPKAQVRLYDPKLETSWRCQGVIESDIVIFAVPPKQYENSLRELVPRMPLRSIIVDVCTVKVRTLRILEEISDGRPYISCHPMFGPQSYKDNGHSLQGLQVVICGHTLTERAASLWTDLCQKVGLKLITMTADGHDQSQAIEQLLTQRIGSVVRRAGFGLNEIGAHTVSGKHFYKAMEIVGEDERLFKEAAQLNPYWAEIWARYQLAEAQLNLDLLSSH